MVSYERLLVSDIGELQINAWDPFNSYIDYW